MRKNFFSLLLIFASMQWGLLAQQTTVDAKIDSVQIWIGQQTKLSFEYTQQPDEFVQTPIFSDSIINKLELIDMLPTDTIANKDGYLSIAQSYIVTCFEDTLLLIPPFPFVKGEDTIWSPDLSLKVIQPFVIDTTQIQVADIKDVFKPKFSLWYFIKKAAPWVLAILLLGAIVFLVIYLVKNRKKAPEAIEKAMKISPYDLAIGRLNKIKQEKLWQQSRHKEYHSELTETLRAYIEGEFEVPAMEMTSAEILDSTEFLKAEFKDAYAKLRQILQLADLIKFAKWNVGPDEHERSLTDAFAFVEATHVIIEEAEKEEEEVTDDI